MNGTNILYIRKIKLELDTLCKYKMNFKKNDEYYIILKVKISVYIKFICNAITFSKYSQ